MMNAPSLIELATDMMGFLPRANAESESHDARTNAHSPTQLSTPVNYSFLWVYVHVLPMPGLINFTSLLTSAMHM